MSLVFKLLLCACVLSSTLAHTENENRVDGITVTTVINSELFSCTAGGRTGAGTDDGKDANGEFPHTGVCSGCNITSDVLDELKSVNGDLIYNIYVYFCVRICTMLI